MGLDMYLEGHKYHPSHGDNVRPTCKGGHEIKSTTLDLGFGENTQTYMAIL